MSHDDNYQNVPEAFGLVKVATDVDGNDIYLSERLVYAENKLEYIFALLLELANFCDLEGNEAKKLESYVDRLTERETALRAFLQWICERLK